MTSWRQREIYRKLTSKTSADIAQRNGQIYEIRHVYNCTIYFHNFEANRAENAQTCRMMFPKRVNDNMSFSSRGKPGNLSNGRNFINSIESTYTKDHEGHSESVHSMTHCTGAGLARILSVERRREVREKDGLIWQLFPT